MSRCKYMNFLRYHTPAGLFSRILFRAAFPALVILLALSGAGLSAAEPEEPAVVLRGAEQGAPVTPYIFDGDLRELPPPRAWRPGDPIKDIPIRYYRPPGSALIPPAGVPGIDPLLAIQSELEETSWPSFDIFTTPSRNYTGLELSGVNPPDPVGDIGPDHYIQMTNSTTGYYHYDAIARIYDKAAPIPNILATFNPASLAKGLCSQGWGDPIVLYDRQADRWLLSEMDALGQCLCVYISATGDPVSGGWYAYEFKSTVFTDYPKYSVWATDANGGAGSYVVTSNDDPDGPGVYALDRGAMLAGEKATFIRFSMPPLSGFRTHGPAPAEPDGPNGPPTAEPAIIMRHHDTEIHEGPEAPEDLLEIWLLDADWENPGNTTLTQAASIDVAEFDSYLCGDRAGQPDGCFEQPDEGPEMDTLRQIMMHRLQYYNHGDFETLVGNFVVDVDGEEHGGIRWFELRRPIGGEWTLHQEGTYAIDEDHRWMGSVAMDQAGNIALGYSITSETTYPSLRYTGRMADDALGWMTQPETEIHAGASAYVSYRWGDYAAMSLDPEDDCTFWFTSMDTRDDTYWRTQIASFRFGNCGCETVPPPPWLETEVDNEDHINLFWEDSEEEIVTEYLVQRSRVSGGPYETLALVPDTSPGVAGGPDYLFEDDDVSGGITYYYVVVARDGEGCRSRPLNEVEVCMPGACTLPPEFEGLQSAASAGAETCTIDLVWDEAESPCSGPVAYNIYRSTVSGFMPVPENMVATEVEGTTAQDSVALESGVTYYYIVRAVNLANGLEEGNLVEREASPAGPGSGNFLLFFGDFEDPDSFDAWTVVNEPDHKYGEWELADYEEQRPPMSEGFYALSWSGDHVEKPFATASTLISPAIDTDLQGLVSVTLDYKHYLWAVTFGPNNVAMIEVWDGEDWQLAMDWSSVLGAVISPPLDITAHAAGNPELRVRFRHENSFENAWWAVEDVGISAEIYNTCTTESESP